MALFRRSGHPQAPTQVPESKIETSRSLGLKALLESLKADGRYSILDLGPALGANIEFLSQFSSKIRVEDLYQTLSEGKFFERGEEPLDDTILGRMLSIPNEERFDIVLSWDLVNYFKPEELRALIRYLDRFCRNGTFFFAIGSTLKEMPALPTNFKILDAQTLLYSAGSVEMRPCPRYAPRDLSLLMSGFRVHSSYILRNGMQEYVFVHD